MRNNIKEIITSVLMTACIASTTTFSVKAETVDANKLYADAYNATMNALNVRTQKSVNVARPKIEALRGTAAEFAIGEFSHQVDTVQHPILVKFVSSYDEAVSALAKVTADPSLADVDDYTGISVQKRIEKARQSLDTDMPAIWRSSYSSGLDKVQQDYQKLALDRVQEFKDRHGNGLGRAQGMAIVCDIYNNTTDTALQAWAYTMILNIA